MSKAGYALDAKAGGFGLISLSYHATAVHSDPITDHLYLVLDENNEPTDVLLPLASTAVVPDGLTIFQFDGDDTSDMVFRWKGKLNLMARPTTLHFSRVRALGYDNLVFKTYADGVLIDSYVVTSSNLVRLPGIDSPDSYEFELIGTSTARTFAADEHPDEVP